MQKGRAGVRERGLGVLVEMVHGERETAERVALSPLMDTVISYIHTHLTHTPHSEGERGEREKGWSESDVTLRLRVIELVYEMMKWGVSIEKEEEIVEWAEEMEREANRRREKREEEEEDNEDDEVMRGGGERRRRRREEEKEWERIGDIGALISKEWIRKERKKRGEGIRTEGEREREIEKLRREREEEGEKRKKAEREKEEAEEREREEKKRREERERERVQLEKEAEELRRRECERRGVHIITQTDMTVVKIPNREITIQEGNRFHNNSSRWETIIIGNKMSRV